MRKIGNKQQKQTENDRQLGTLYRKRCRGERWQGVTSGRMTLRSFPAAAEVPHKGLARFYQSKLLC